MLNKDLIKRQKLTKEDVEKLKFLHEQMDGVVHYPEEYDDPVSLIQELEFDMQLVWKFEKDSRRHTHWLRIKGCCCPKLDNYDRLGTVYRVVSADCKWHGGNK